MQSVMYNKTYSFSKRFSELKFVSGVLYDGNHKFIIIAMPFDSFYHFHVSDLQICQQAWASQRKKKRQPKAVGKSGCIW